VPQAFDAVTIDAYGTLLTLEDPVPLLAAALREHGAERTFEQVERGFRAEAAYYVPRSHEGRDETTLALLRRDCARVFLEGADAADVDPDRFRHAFVDALRFVPMAGAVEACEALAARGLALAVVSNWDVGLHEHVRRLGLDLPVVTSAEAGAAKPDAAIFRLALERLGVAAARALHVGDSHADEQGARAVGMQFRPAPLAAAVEDLL
jgi:putative hydrolase of the HAD superfamily